MRAIVLAVGDELTSGQTVDTNSAWLAGELGSLGIPPVAHWTVADDADDIADAITAAAGRAEVVIVTGGLGPTADDLTADGLARAMGVRLELNERSLAQIEEFFSRRARRMTPANRKQAMIPVGAEALDNPLGTAPAIAARVGEAQVFVLPGVPQEMRPLFTDVVAPRLTGGRQVILRRAVHTFGEGESDLAARVADLMDRDANPTVGTTVAAGLVSLRITARADSADEAQRLADRTVAEIRRRLGSLVVGVDGETMASVIGEMLRERGQTLAVAESCTGGMIGELITAVPGCSAYFCGGVLAYHNGVKHRLLGVPGEALEAHGAVSDVVASAMASGCRERIGTDWAISTTGIAGPGGGSPEKPVGLVYVALAGPDGASVGRLMLPGTRDLIRLRTAMAAMNALRLALLGA